MNVQNLVIFIHDNHGAEISKLFYIGLKGEFMSNTTQPIITIYEAAARPVDHMEAIEQLRKNTHRVD